MTLIRTGLRWIAMAISAVGNAIGMILIGLMVIHVTVEVIARGVFLRPIPGTIEIGTYYYMIAVAFVPLGYVQWRRQHIEAEAISNFIPARLRRITTTLGVILSIGVAGLLTYGTVLAALRQTRFGASVWTTVGQIPVWPGRWMLPLGFGALAIVLLYQLLFDREPDDGGDSGGTGQV